VADRLPAFPWDSLVSFRRRAEAYPGGAVDFSMGTPVDPTPPPIRDALAAAADAPGYPLTAGSAELRAKILAWLRTHCGAVSLAADAILPTIGTKEIVAWLPTLLGLGPGDIVVHPKLAYPTYQVGARLAGARSVASDSLTALGPAKVRLVWLNSPSNPTGRVLPTAHIRKVVDWARERGAVVASDECYLDLGFETSPVSVLSVCEGNHAGVLSVHSLSKRSNLAGYRAGFMAGDPALIAELLAVRKHAGMIVPAPVQQAMIAALSDPGHVEEQRQRYAARRALLRPAFEAAGFRIEHSEAGLYLWMTRDEDCWRTVDWFAERGIIVAPGTFYGEEGARHVRVALTATDERVAAAVSRLS
jgi:succinyldiaminopimelate transaminase